MPDIAQQLAATVIDAGHDGQPLSIHGSGSKSFLRLRDEGKPLSILQHSGIVAYEPTELVLTVRAGTSISEVESVLRQNGQMLAFEPPEFNGGTIGGAIASGLSGPRRPWAGAARDFVLGTRIINGKGEELRFGGQVMKNVAGYDISRLMTGAYGVLGIILDVSIKVLPLPETEVTKAFELSAEEAIRQSSELSGRASPISATCWYQDRFMVRLSGTDSGVRQTSRLLGGELLRDADNFWLSIRNHRHKFFQQGNFWRLSIPPSSPHILQSSSEQLIDWGGAQRWVRTEELPDSVTQHALSASGYAEQWHTSDKRNLRHPLSDGVRNIHKKIKQAFDPKGIINPGAFYNGL